MASNRTMGGTEWALLLTLSLLWGGSFFFGKYALRELEPLTLVLCRVAIAAAALHLALIATGQRLPRDARRWGAYLVMGLLNNVVPFALIFWGQTRLTSGLASILNATTPLFTVLLAHLLTQDERLTRNRLAGVLLGFAGVTVMIGPDALSGLGLGVLAQVAVLAAAVSYALAGIYGRRLRGSPPLVNAAGQLTCSTLVTALLVPMVDRPWQSGMPSGRTLFAVAGLALLSTALGYTIYFRLLSTAGATNLLLVTFLIPISALLLGTLFLDEGISAQELAGMLLIGFGLAAIDGRLIACLRATPARRDRVPVSAP